MNILITADIKFYLNHWVREENLIKKNIFFLICTKNHHIFILILRI
jgi:hypothetical protein